MQQNEFDRNIEKLVRNFSGDLGFAAKNLKTGSEAQFDGNAAELRYSCLQFFSEILNWVDTILGTSLH